MSTPQQEPTFIANLTRALKALAKFTLEGASDETSVTAKLIRDMVKGLESGATEEMEEERQALLLATKDLIVRMRAALSDVLQQRDFLLAAQELKRTASVLYYRISPQELPKQAPLSETQLLTRDLLLAIAPKSESGSPVPPSKIPHSGASSPANRTPTKDETDELIGEADQLLKELNTPVLPKAAVDRDWVQMPSLQGGDEKKVGEIIAAIPINPPAAAGVTALDTKSSSAYSSHPLAQLERLLTTERGLNLLATMCSVLPPENREELAAALVLMFAHTQSDVTFLRWTIHREVSQCADEANLFKAGEFASQICKSYARLHGLQFACQLVDGVVEDICKNNVDLELDPQRASSDEIKKNASRFGKIADHFVDDICRASKCPIQLRVLYNIIEAEVAKKFPNNRLVCASTQFYVRFLSAVLVEPDHVSFRPAVSGRRDSVPTAYEMLRCFATKGFASRDFAHTTEKTRRSLGLLSCFLGAATADIPVPTYAEPAMTDHVMKAKERLMKFMEDLTVLTADTALPRCAFVTEEICLQLLHHLRLVLLLGVPKLREKFAATLYPESALRSQLDQAEAIINAPFKEEALASHELLDAHLGVISSNFIFRSNLDPESTMQSRVIRASSNAEELHVIQNEHKKMRQLQLAASPRRPSKRDLKPSPDEALVGCTRSQFLSCAKEGRKWETVFVVLKGRDLFIYAERKSKEPKATLRIDKFASVEFWPGPLSYGFVVRTPGENTHFGNEKLSDSDAWIAALQKTRQEFSVTK